MRCTGERLLGFLRAPFNRDAGAGKVETARITVCWRDTSIRRPAGCDKQSRLAWLPKQVTKWRAAWKHGDRSRRSWPARRASRSRPPIPQQQIELALEAYGLELDDNERYIYFFDTPDLELFEQGVIARARRIVGAGHDSTIKFRPVEPDSVPAMWRKYSGFKIEADSGDKGVVKSASLDDARGQGPDQAGGRRQGADRQPVHAKNNCCSCSAWRTRRLITPRLS